MNGLSIVFGLAAAALLLLLAARGPRRTARILVLGLVLIIVLTAWALWHETFPATFGPFAFACIFAAPLLRTRVAGD